MDSSPSKRRASSSANTASSRSSVKARASARVSKSGSIVSDAKTCSETVRSDGTTAMSIKPYGKRPPALGLEKLQRLSQAGLLQRTALTAAQGQDGVAASAHSP